MKLTHLLPKKVRDFGGQLIQVGTRLLVNPLTLRLLLEPIFILRGQRKTSGKEQPERILVLFLAAMGDTVMASSFLRELRQAYPDAKISLLVNALHANYVERCPYVDEILLNRIEFRPGSFVFWSRLSWQLGFAQKELWPKRFDWAINPWCDFDVHGASYLAYLSGAHKRIGYSTTITPEKTRHDGVRDPFYTHLLYDNVRKHEVQKNLDVLTFIGHPPKATHLEYWCDDADRAHVDALLSELPDGGPLIALGIGARRIKRQWPIERFVEVAQSVTETHNARFVLIGGEQDVESAKHFESTVSNPTVNALGKTTLRQTAELLSRCTLFVGNDSGPMHLAVAAQIPVVEISCLRKGGMTWHNNSPVRFGPWTPHCSVIQPLQATAPCEDFCAEESGPHCILNISAQMVLEGILQWLPPLSNLSRTI